MKQALALFLVLAALPAAAQQRPPVPDPRLEVALSTTLINATERAVEVRKTVPVIAPPRRPAVEEPDMAQMRESVYVERSLLPPRGPYDPNAVHIRGSDR